jgi:hypothetical protein
LELALTGPEKNLTISATDQLKALVVTAGQAKELGEIKVKVLATQSSKKGS